MTNNAIATFKHDFIDNLNDFALEANVMASGRASFQNRWRDDLGGQSIAVSTAAIDGVVAVLSAVGIISASLAAAISIPFSIIGILATFAFFQWRDKKKLIEYARAEKKLERDNLTDEISQIADTLVNLHRAQLENATPEEATKLAEACSKSIITELLKNDAFDFAELMQPDSLMKVISPAHAGIFQANKYGISFFANKREQDLTPTVIPAKAGI